MLLLIIGELIRVPVPPAVLQVWSQCSSVGSLKPTTPSTTCLLTPRTEPNRLDLDYNHTAAHSALFQHALTID